MTGFGVCTRESAAGTVTLELRSVNSRFLDLQFRMNDDLRTLEPMLREAIIARLQRGKVECRLSFGRKVASGNNLAVNDSLLSALTTEQQTVLDKFPDARPLSVNELLRWPGVLADDSPGFDTLLAAIVELTDAALDDMIASRRREGEKLAAMIGERVARMRELVATVAPRMPAVVAEYQARLAARLRDAVATLDEERIRQEVALYATRIDVAEELTRLVTHLDEVMRILKAGGAAGKRLDFLMQELNREANTLASKSPATDITAIAMEMKVLIEQMREQVQNIE